MASKIQWCRGTPHEWTIQAPSPTSLVKFNLTDTSTCIKHHLHMWKSYLAHAVVIPFFTRHPAGQSSGVEGYGLALSASVWPFPSSQSLLLHPSRTAPSFIAWLSKCHSIQDCWLLWILLVVCLAPRKGSPQSPHRKTWVGSVSWAAVSSKAPGDLALQKADWSSLTIHWVLNMKYVLSKANAVIPHGMCLLDHGWRL